MSKRGKIGRGRSKRMFTKHARKVHKKNIPRKIMRGGIRL